MKVSTTGIIMYEHVCASLHVADNLAEPIAEVGCVAEGGDLEEGRIGLGRPGPGVPNVKVVSTAVAQRKRNPRVGRLVVVVGIVPLNQPLVGLEVVVGGSVDVGRVRVGNPVGVERTTPFVLGAAGTALLVDRIDDPPPVLGGKVDAWFVLLDKARASAQPIRISVDQSHILGLLRV